ncbi:MAG TPA: hypothetical protein VLS27_07455 [Gammaproteobacteria bacterium]|nr:hypothetical protein [Gammaproteobacteria bacterium]
MVTGLGPNPDNGAQLLVFELSIDPVDIAGLGDDELAAQLAERPKPVRALRTNASPCVVAYEDSPERLRSRASNIAKVRSRAACLRQDEAFRQKLIAAFIATREDKEQSPHVEEQVYDDFADNADQTLMTQFHELPWADGPGILANLVDHCLKTLGERLVYVEAPDTLSDHKRAPYDVAIAERLMADENAVPWHTLSKAIADTKDMVSVAGGEGEEARLLIELCDYLVQRFEDASVLVT